MLMFQRRFIRSYAEHRISGTLAMGSHGVELEASDGPDGS